MKTLKKLHFQEKKALDLYFEENKNLENESTKKMSEIYEELLSKFLEFEKTKEQTIKAGNLIFNLPFILQNLQKIKASEKLKNLLSEILMEKVKNCSIYGLINKQNSEISNNQFSGNEKMLLKQISALILENQKDVSENYSTYELTLAKNKIKELKNSFEAQVAEKETIVENYETQIRELSNQLLLFLDLQNK